MKIYIPTRGRPDRQRTLEALTDAGLSPVLVLSKDDPTRRGHYHDAHTPLVVNASNIHEKRQAILNYTRKSGGGKFVMMDDDLTFFARDRRGKFAKAGVDELASMVEMLEDVLDTHAHVGIVDKFMCQGRPRGVVEHGRYNQVLAYNTTLFPKPWPTFRLITNQEHDFHLQLATRGCAPAIICEYSKDAAYYAEGGCSHYRTPSLERVMFKEMRRLWPDYVRLLPTQKRPGLRMQVAWKKAVNDGRKKREA